MSSSKHTPLVSIIALSYKESVQHRNECLNSILSQTYDNIELIITNDGADGFDECKTNELVDRRKKANISSLIINKNEQNLGTVKNCNLALSLSSGDYILFIACDDVYNNDNVITDMVNGFNVVPTDVMAIVGQLGMYNSDLSECTRLYVNKATQKTINTLTPNELYRNYLVYRCLFPAAAIIYKREVFDIYGKFDEKYFLLEDWPYSIFSAKRGMRYYYLDIMCVSHRDGGVSQSELDANNHVYRKYVMDYISMFEDILLDDSLDIEITSIVHLNQSHHRQLYYNIFETPIQKEPSIKAILANKMNQHINVRNIFTINVFSFMSIFVGIKFLTISSYNLSTTLGYFFIYLGLLYFISSVFMIAFKFLIKLFN